LHSRSRAAQNDYDTLLELIGDARFVLFGEASHATHEFYFERAAITKRLIAEKAFTVVAIEANSTTRVVRHIQVGNRSNARAFGTLVSCRKLIRSSFDLRF